MQNIYTPCLRTTSPYNKHLYNNKTTSENTIISHMHIHVHLLMCLLMHVHNHGGLGTLCYLICVKDHWTTEQFDMVMQCFCFQACLHLLYYFKGYVVMCLDQIGLLKSMSFQSGKLLQTTYHHCSMYRYAEACFESKMQN